MTFRGTGPGSLIAVDLNSDGRTDPGAGFAESSSIAVGESPVALTGEDLNEDGVPDIACELDGYLAAFINHSTPPFGLDFNHNSSPDECEALPRFHRGEPNSSGTTDIPDGIYLLSWLFTGGPEPAPPGPTDKPCGTDTDASGSPGDLGCEAYSACR